MPEHEAAGLSAMRGSGARGNPNRAYRRYTAIPLIDYIMCGTPRTPPSAAAAAAGRGLMPVMAAASISS